MDEEQRTKLFDEAYRLGFEYEKSYKGCAQCTVAALQDCLNLQEHSIFKAASGLSGGCGLTIEGLCGGFTGGALVIGQLCGRERSDFADRAGRRHTAYDAVERLVRLFQKEFGSIVCSEVQKGVFGRSYNLRDPADFRTFEADGAHVSKCPDVVGRAARLALKVIFEAKLLGAG
ncbi:MAG: C_GCAxxG_C_C family protein [Bradymonadales bacterium]|nr:C_GCAxxG_C_C family protein [Bradymonadales bacterium]